MTSQDTKDKIFAKLKQEPKPVMTQSVTVEPLDQADVLPAEEPRSEPQGKEVAKKPLKTARQTAKKEDTEEKEHFNIFVPTGLARSMRVHKAMTKISIQDIMVEALTEYLAARGALIKK